jgi:hypothetical protein
MHLDAFHGEGAGGTWGAVGGRLGRNKGACVSDEDDGEGTRRGKRGGDRRVEPAPGAKRGGDRFIEVDARFIEVDARLIEGTAGFFLSPQGFFCRHRVSRGGYRQGFWARSTVFGPPRRFLEVPQGFFCRHRVFEPARRFV